MRFGFHIDRNLCEERASSLVAPPGRGGDEKPKRCCAGLGLGGLRWTMGGLRCLSILAGGGSVIPVGRCGGMGCGPKRAAPPPYRPASGGVM